MYYDISIRFKTSLSNAFFYEDEDNDRFNEWFGEQLSKVGLYHWEMIDNPTGIEGVSELKIIVSDFDADDHNMFVSVHVDNDTHDFDELADNQVLLDYIERNIAPKVIDELNDLLSGILLPMNEGNDFYQLKFDGNEFYCLLGYSEKFGFYPMGRLQNTPFVVEDDFEVYV